MISAFDVPQWSSNYDWPRDEIFNEKVRMMQVNANRRKGTNVVGLQKQDFEQFMRLQDPASDPTGTIYS